MNARRCPRSVSQMASLRGRRRLWALACGAVALAGASNVLATKAWSQGIHSDNPAPAGQTYLTGDWGGLRSYLERNGVTLTFTDTTDFLANVSGGIKTGAVGLGAVQPQLDLDLQKLAGWQGGLLHVHGLVTYGPLFSANYLGNILAVSNIEAGPIARLYAFWYEQGIAAAVARVGDNARGLDADVGFFSGNPFFPVRSSEAVIELMYQAQLKPWWMLQPDLQYVINPGGGVLNSDGSLRRNALVIGVRSSLNF